MKVSKAKIKLIITAIILLCVSSTTVFAFDTYVEEVQYKLSGCRLQISRAQHFIDYGTLQGLSESDESIQRAYVVIKQSKEEIEKLNKELGPAAEKDRIEGKKKQEALDEETKNQILASGENYEKLQSIMRVMGLSKIEDIPIEFIKSMGLYDYTYNLLKSENRLTGAWASLSEGNNSESTGGNKPNDSKVTESKDTNDGKFKLGEWIDDAARFWGEE